MMNIASAETINALSKEIHANNVDVGWWDDPDRCLYTVCQLIITEIAEATEGERKNLMDDHLPHRKMGEVELADALIRTLDLGGKLELEYTSDYREGWFDLATVSKNEDNLSIYFFHLWAITATCRIAESIVEGTAKQIQYDYCGVIDILLATSHLFGYDIMGAALEKIEYNKTRTDHTREHRATENGKKV